MTGHPHHPAILYHYCCDHAAPMIRKDGAIKPAALLVRDERKLARMAAARRRLAEGIGQFAWFTDLAPPAPPGPLGLQPGSLDCDRTAFCFEVVPDWDSMRWWMQARRTAPEEMLNLELEPGSMPRHWFVSEEPVAVYRELNARTGGAVEWPVASQRRR